MTDGVKHGLDPNMLEVEPIGESCGHCDCCGGATKRIWGWIHRGDTTLAAYFSGWTEDKPDHGVALDLILGRWGGDAAPSDRYAVALDFRHETGTFMVVDAASRAVDTARLAAAALSRSEVVDTPLAEQVLALADAVRVACSIDSR